MAQTISRRTFVKAGLLGTVVLATAGGVYRATRTQPSPTGFILAGEAKEALAAVVTVMLDGAIFPSQPDAIESAIGRVQAAIAGLPLVTQKEIENLFGLLTLAPARWFLAGVPDRWSVAKREDVARFLQDWRAHRFAMLQSAYQALHDLILGSWYADESTWESIGYSGPTKELG